MFKYLVKSLTSQNCIQEETKSRLRSGNTCYNLVQNLLSSSLLSTKIKIKIHISTVFPVVLYGCETLSSEEHRLESVRELGAEEDIWA